MKRSVKLFVIACAVVAAAAGGGAFLVGSSSSKDAHAGVFSGHFYSKDPSLVRYHWVWGVYVGSAIVPGGKDFIPKRCGYSSTAPSGGFLHAQGTINQTNEPWDPNGTYVDNPTANRKSVRAATGIVSYTYLDEGAKVHKCTELSTATTVPTGDASTVGAAFS